MKAKPRKDEWVRTVLLSLLFALAFRIGVAQAYVIDGPSMEPTLLQDERVVVARTPYGLSLPFVRDAVASWALPEVGDVVIIESPVDGRDLIKRVIGLPGDVIEIRDGRVRRNGEPLETGRVAECHSERFREWSPPCELREEAHGLRRWQTSDSPLSLEPSFRALRVPAGHVYVLGDHRDRSNDSRYFGPVPTTRLRGRAIFVR